MNTTRVERRIQRMVRLLGVLGLAMVVIVSAQIGFQLKAIHRSRQQLQEQQGRLSRASQAIVQRADAARREIQGILDENLPAVGKPDAAAQFALTVQGLLRSTNGSSIALQRLGSLANDMSTVERGAVLWRGRYDVVWQDVGQELTLTRARDLITALRAAVETMEGKRRLRNAIELNHWKAARGEEAEDLATLILAKQGQEESRGPGEFKDELTQVAGLVEIFSREEEADNLANLKDNQLKPALDRLTFDAGSLTNTPLGDGVNPMEAVDNLKTILLGERYKEKEALQNVPVGRSGLYALRQDTLALRREREKLAGSLAMVSHDIDVAEKGFAESTQTQSQLLAGKMERTLRSSWRELIAVGTGCSGLFAWLAWLISRAIRDQVKAIESAKAEAESGRQTAQRLAQAQENAAQELGRMTEALTTSEAFLHSVVE
ncbi:MAG TPA: hypothetical protein VGD78_11735, partial [Chthoniobacterales bacterium]